MSDHATEQPAIRCLTAQEARERTAELSTILIDCVDGGASVSFMAPLARGNADRFWRSVADGVVVPGYALMPDGQPCDTTIFYKMLSGR